MRLWFLRLTVISFFTANGYFFPFPLLWNKSYKVLELFPNGKVIFIRTVDIKQLGKAVKSQATRAMTSYSAETSRISGLPN